MALHSYDRRSRCNHGHLRGGINRQNLADIIAPPPGLVANEGRLMPAAREGGRKMAMFEVSHQVVCVVDFYATVRPP